MNNIEEKKDCKELNEQERLEDIFHKTTFGKFIRFITIMAIVAIAIGAILGIFEKIVYTKELDINKYQTIIDFGRICFECGEDSIIYGGVLYAILIPELIKENKKKDDKSYKKDKRMKTIILTLIALAMVGPMLQLLYQILCLFI